RSPTATSFAASVAAAGPRPRGAARHEGHPLRPPCGRFRRADRMTPPPRGRSARPMRLSLCLICGAAAAVAALPAASAAGRLALMGTWLSVSVEAGSRSSALDASEAAVREVERIERLLSTWREGGPLDRLNRAAPGCDVPIGAETSELLGKVFAWRLRTGGAFDPTVLPLVRAW